MKKRILAALVASAAVLSLAGCNTDNNSGSGAGSGGSSGNSSSGNSSSGNSQPEKPVEITDDDDTLTILAWDSNGDITNMVKFFCEQTGTPEDKVVISRQGKDGKGGRDQYPQYLKGDGDADLMCLEADWILQYINDATLTVPYSQLGITEDNLKDNYAYTVAIGKNEAGTLMAASFQAAPGGFAYRADLAEQYLGVKTPEEMQAKVKDWDTFKATAAELYEASGEKCALAATEGGLWQVYQANRTKPWVQDGKLVMDNAEQFYDIAKELSDKKYITNLTQWSDGWYAGSKDGSFLGEFVPTWGATGLEGSILGDFAGAKNENKETGVEATPGEYAGKWGFCEGPNGYFWGGTWLGVSTKCNSKSLAKKFVEFFTVTADTMQGYAEFTGDFVNNKTAMNNIITAGTNKNPVLKDGQDQFQIFAKTVDSIKMDGLITKYDATIKDDFNASVQGYLSGEYATKEDAINAFKAKVKADLPELVVE